MIYISILLLVFVCVLLYDVYGYNRHKQGAFYLLCVVYCALSAFQYMVGSDLPVYCRFYEKLNVSTFSIQALFSYSEENLQPGWVLLQFLCRFITSDFVLPKTIVAVFLNVTIFSFFKKESNYPFFCVFIYALMSYLVLNFNVLRQSIAVAFFLIGYPSLKKRKYVKYAILALCAYMFHNSAWIIFAFPLLKLIRFGKATPYILVSFLVLVLFSFTVIDLEALSFSLIESGLFSDDISTMAHGYMNSEALGVRESWSLFSLRRLFYGFLLVYYLFKEKDSYLSYYGVIYLIIDTLSSFMPILWRFRLYFEIPFIVIVSNVIMTFPYNFLKGKLIRIKGAMLLILISAMVYTTTSDYFARHPGEKYRYIDQYYPYHSVFNPIIDYDRYNYFQ